MSESIIDGTGSGYRAKVDNKNRLVVTAAAEDVKYYITRAGFGFIVSSNPVTLTSDSESAVLYFKTNEDSDILIADLTIKFGPSTGGSGVILGKEYAAPTGGTLLSDANSIYIPNLNDGSSATVDPGTVCYAGDEGKTVTGGVDIITQIYLPNSVESRQDVFIVKKGNSFAYKITPPTGNTSMTLFISFGIYLLDYL